MTSLALYGLKTCDTCRKARKALDGAQVRYEFHDFREEPPAKAKLSRWAKTIGPDKLLNKSSTTWRNLPAADKENLDEKKMIELMAAHPTLIRRPIIERGPTQVFAGWSRETEAELLKQGRAQRRS